MSVCWHYCRLVSHAGVRFSSLSQPVTENTADNVSHSMCQYSAERFTISSLHRVYFLCFPSLHLGLARTVVVIAVTPWSRGPGGRIELRKLGAKSNPTVVQCERRRTAEIKSDSWWMGLDTYWQAKFAASLVRCDTFVPVAATLWNRLGENRKDGECERSVKWLRNTTICHG